MIDVVVPNYYLEIISGYKRQIVQEFGEKTWQEIFEKFQKTNDINVFENVVKSQISENANLKNFENLNLENSAKNTKNLQIPNPQDFSNDNKM